VSVSSPKQQAIGQEEMASSYTRRGQLHQKGCQALEQAAQGSGGVTIPGGIDVVLRDMV